jgi:hypothetical protein
MHFPQSKAIPRRADWRKAASLRSEAGAVTGIHRCRDLTLSWPTASDVTKNRRFLKGNCLTEFWQRPMDKGRFM